MKGLLRANFARLWKTKAFWGCLIAPAAFCLLMCVLDGKIGVEIFNQMANAAPFSLFFSAIFTAMYIGTDNSEKTVRNKLIPGIPRIKVYFANLITVSAGMVLIFAASWITVTVYALTGGGYLGIGAGTLALYITFCLIAGAAMTAVCTLPATLVTSKSAATVLTVVITIGMFLGTRYLSQLSTSPLHYTSSVYDPETGEYVVAEEYDDYTFTVSEGVEKAAKMLYEILPTTRISDAVTDVRFMDSFSEFTDVGKITEPILYSLGVLAAVTAVGIPLFARKDLK